VGPQFGAGFGFHRGFHGNSVVVSPFFGFPYYYPPVVPVVPYYSEPLYLGGDNEVAPNPAPPPNEQPNPNLNTQVQPVPPSQVQEFPAQSGATSQAPARNIVLIFKDGRRIETPGYALVGSTLWILNAQTATQVPVSDIDTRATQTENLKRGVSVAISPTQP